MPAITIEIDEETVARLSELAQICTDVDQDHKGATTHGALTVPALLAMLAEDAAMVISRPESWEGTSMAALLSSHGYLY
jgi:hypothetical protein